MRDADQVLRIQDRVVAMSDLHDSQRVHVVNDDPAEDLMAFDAEVAS